MSTAEALKSEIDNTPEPLLQEVYDFLVLLKQQTARKKAVMLSIPATPQPTRPDFLGRLKTIYGDRMGIDSKEIMDYLREERL